VLDKLNADADVDVKYFAQEALTGNNEGAESLYLIILFFFYIRRNFCARYSDVVLRGLKWDLARRRLFSQAIATTAQLFC